MKIGVVVPHIFMHRDILPRVIFSPGHLAIDLVNGLHARGHEVTLLSPGPVDVDCRNLTADLSLFEAELARRGDNYVDLLRKHPMTFVTLARQVQAELIARAYAMANSGEFDIVHIYTNEEEIGYTFVELCSKPVVFTHHDPYNFLIRYKSIMPRYKHLNWISISQAQRRTMPADTNWVGNVYHGLNEPKLTPVVSPSRDYFAYLGRIIQPKGVHLAIAAVRKYNETAATPLKLKIAGKHYAESSKDSYWQTAILPELDDTIKYVGFIDTQEAKRNFLGNARALLVPSLFDEPFGMVTIEAFACATPVIALDSGALPEVIDDGKTGYIVTKSHNDTDTVAELSDRLHQIEMIDRTVVHDVYEQRFTSKRMIEEYAHIHRSLIKI
ncbi:MAG: glycosyltransferase [Candidatus Saccharimonadales bacterium]